MTLDEIELAIGHLTAFQPEPWEWYRRRLEDANGNEVFRDEAVYAMNVVCALAPKLIAVARAASGLMLAHNSCDYQMTPSDFYASTPEEFERHKKACNEALAALESDNGPDGYPQSFRGRASPATD